MATLAELVVKIGADVAGFDSSVSGVNKKMRAFGRDMTAMGRTLAIGVTAPIVGMGVAILNSAGNFEQGMKKVQAIARPTGDEFARLEGLAKNLGSTTKFSATQAAEGMAFLGMAGFETNEIVGAMPGLLSLAAAGQLELGEAADIASNILSGFGENAGEAGRLADVMALAAASSNTSVIQLGEAMAKVAPVAKRVGLSIEETTASIGKLGDAGIQGEEAGTALRAVISSLIKPSAEASSALGRLGVEVFDSSGKMRPFIQIMGDLGTASASATDLVTIFGRRAQAAAGILADQGVAGLQGFTDELVNSGGAADEMAKTMNEGLKGATVELTSALEGLAIAIGDSGLVEWATDAAKGTTGLTRSIAGLPPVVLKVGTVLAGLAAAAGPAFLSIGFIAEASAKSSKSLGLLLAPLNALGPAFAALGVPIGVAGAALAGVVGWFALVVDAKSRLDGILSQDDAIRTYEKALKDVGVQVEKQGNETLPGYLSRLEQVASVTGDLSKTIRDNMLQAFLDANKGMLEFMGVLDDYQRVINDIKGIEPFKEFIDPKVEKDAAALRDRLKELGIEVKVVGREAKETDNSFDVLNAAVARSLGLTTSAIPEWLQLERSITGVGKSAGDASSPAARLGSEIGKTGKSAKTTAGNLEELAEAEDRMARAAKEAAERMQDLGEELKVINDNRLHGLDGKIRDVNERLKELAKTAPTVSSGAIDISGALGSLDEAMGSIPEPAKKTQEALIQVSTIVTDLSAGLADAIIDGGGFVKVIDEIGKALIRSFIESGIREALKETVQLLGKIFGFDGGEGGSLGGIFGGSSSSSSSPGGLGGLGGGGGGGDPITAAIGLVLQGIDLNKQFQMEHTLNAIEGNTRFSGIVTQKELPIQSKNLVFITGNTDNIKETLWAIRDMIANGITIAGGQVAVDGPVEVTGNPAVVAAALADLVRNPRSRSGPRGPRHGPPLVLSPGDTSGLPTRSPRQRGGILPTRSQLEGTGNRSIFGDFGTTGPAGASSRVESLDPGLTGSLNEQRLRLQAFAAQNSGNSTSFLGGVSGKMLQAIEFNTAGILDGVVALPLNLESIHSVNSDISTKLDNLITETKRLAEKEIILKLDEEVIARAAFSGANSLAATA